MPDEGRSATWRCPQHPDLTPGERFPSDGGGPYCLACESGRVSSPHECHAGCPHDTTPGAWAVSQAEACIACGHERRDHSLSWSRCTRCNCSGMTEGRVPSGHDCELGVRQPTDRKDCADCRRADEMGSVGYHVCACGRYDQETQGLCACGRQR